MNPQTLGVRQRKLLRLILLHHGSLSRGGLTGWAEQRLSLAQRGLIAITDTGSVTLTVTGRALAEELWAGTVSF